MAAAGGDGGHADFAAMFAAGATVAELKAAGATISDLRKPPLRSSITPAAMRAGGYTCAEMEKHLGAFMLREAGFTAAEMRAAGVPAANLLNCGFALRDVVAGGANYWEMRSRGAPAAELEAAGMHAPPPHVPPPPVGSGSGAGVLLPSARVAALAVGETITAHHSEPGTSHGLHVQLTRLAEPEAAALRDHPHKDWLHGDTMYGYAGSGCLCHACGSAFVLVEKVAHADDMTADEQAKWVCERPGCGIVKTEQYKGYGSLFWLWGALEKPAAVA